MYSAQPGYVALSKAGSFLSRWGPKSTKQMLFIEQQRQQKSCQPAIQAKLHANKAARLFASEYLFRKYPLGTLIECCNSQDAVAFIDTAICTQNLRPTDSVTPS